MTIKKCKVCGVTLTAENRASNGSMMCKNCYSKKNSQYYKNKRKNESFVIEYRKKAKARYYQRKGENHER
jgi:uncharacterized Zn finger protein (UPF0148 family)